MNIDKTGWATTTLGDICIKQEENDKENASNRFNRFVKVEHLDPDSLHIKRWGDAGKDELPPTFYKIFRMGQVLYPTRNPHLRRTALATFDCICGEKTLTLEPNKAIVNEKFFPFIFMSSTFIDHATTAIVGSTNPHVRWRDIAQFQFLLPPKDQQARLAELLWAGDAVVEGYGRLAEQINQLRLSFQYEKYNFPETISIGQISTKVGSGKTPLGGDKNYLKEGVVFLRSQNVLKGKISLEDIAYISSETHESMRSSKVQEGDVLLNITGASIGRSAVFEGPGFKEANVNQHVCIIRPIYYSSILLCDYLNSIFGQDQINTLQTGGNRQGLNFQNLRQLQVPNFSESVMIEIENQILKIGQQEDAIGLLIESQKNLQSHLLNQIFTP